MFLHAQTNFCILIMEGVRALEKLEKKILDRVTQLRMQKDISEKQLSRDIGKSPSYLSSMNKNQSMLSLLTLKTICEYLDVSLSDFFDFDDNTYPVKINRIKLELLKLDDEELDIILALTHNMNKHRDVESK